MEEIKTASATDDPAAASGVLSRLLDQVESGERVDTAAETTADTATSAATPMEKNPLGTLLGGAVSNPALLSALPTLLENIGPLLAGGNAARAAGGDRHLDRHTALLCALKPYLGHERQEAVETVIRLCRVWDALERSGISLSGLLSSLGGIGAGTASSAAGGEEVL